MPFRIQGSPYYHFDRTVRIGNQRHRIRGSTGETSKTRAREVEDHAVREKRQEVLDGPRQEQLTVTEALGTYFDHIAADQPSAGTTASQVSALIAGLKARTLIADLTTANLVLHCAKRRAKVTNATVNREVATLRRALTYVGKALNAELPAISWDAVKFKEPQERVRELTVDEEHRLFAALRPDFHGLVRFQIMTGTRLGSALGLQWDHIDFASGTMTFYTMKGGGTHTLPIWTSLVALLSAQPRVDQQVFTYINQRKGARLRFTQAGWKKPWRAALKEASISDFRFHDLRHTAASRITRKAGIEVARAILGHKDLSTTQRYAHVTREDVLRAVDRAEIREVDPKYTQNSRR